MAGRKRIDPVTRISDGRRGYDLIAGKAPDRHYVLTNPNDEDTGTARYLDNGYERETVRPGGPRSAMSRDAKEGATVSRGGQVLVSRPIVEHMADVEVGQELAGALERKILKDGGEDGLRGRGYETVIQRQAPTYAGEEA